jgi:hypothetical protein
VGWWWYGRSSGCVGRGSKKAWRKVRGCSYALLGCEGRQMCWPNGIVRDAAGRMQFV